MEIDRYDPPRHIRMLIKVCGNRDIENIRKVAALTPLLMGFIFVASSPRNAFGLPPEIVRDLPDGVHPVGVFVDASDETIIETCKKYGIKIVQLHGQETPQQCAGLRQKGFTVLKALGLSGSTNWMALATYCNCIDMFVLDSHQGTKGGSGEKFDWEFLKTYPFNTPFLLSGGIGPDDVTNIIKVMRPGLAGIDINSRFEIFPGEKNISSLSKFFVELRKYNEDDKTPVPFWEKE